MSDLGSQWLRGLGCRVGFRVAKAMKPSAESANAIVEASVVANIVSAQSFYHGSIVHFQSLFYLNRLRHMIPINPIQDPVSL